MTIIAASAASLGAQTTPKPTVILVHGAFAGSDSWNGVIAELRKAGYPVIAAANPLRLASTDAAFVSSIVKSVPGPVVLVGHSYGGTVISLAANGNANVKSLVFVSAFAPEAGESTAGLNGKLPGSELGPALFPVTLPDGSKDLYVNQDRFGAVFAPDVPPAGQLLMAVGQRPATEAALNEPSGPGAWKQLPNWWIYGGSDKVIPPATMAWMAERSKAKETVVVPGGSHATLVSHPREVAALIQRAAR